MPNDTIFSKEFVRFVSVFLGEPYRLSMCDCRLGFRELVSIKGELDITI